MTRTVLVEGGVREAMRAMASEPKRRLKAGLRSLAELPEPPDRAPGVKRLDAPGTGEPVYRLRVGVHRAAFVVRARDVRVVHIFHREQGYDWLHRLRLD